MKKFNYSISKTSINSNSDIDIDTKYFLSLLVPKADMQNSLFSHMRETQKLAEVLQTKNRSSCCESDLPSLHNFISVLTFSKKKKTRSKKKQSIHIIGKHTKKLCKA